MSGLEECPMQVRREDGFTYCRLGGQCIGSPDLCQTYADIYEQKTSKKSRQGEHVLYTEKQILRILNVLENPRRIRDIERSTGINRPSLSMYLRYMRDLYLVDFNKPYWKRIERRSFVCPKCAFIYNTSYTDLLVGLKGSPKCFVEGCGAKMICVKNKGD